jgi:hypothetical protein
MKIDRTHRKKRGDSFCGRIYRTMNQARTTHNQYSDHGNASDHKMIVMQLLSQLL